MKYFLLLLGLVLTASCNNKKMAKDDLTTITVIRKQAHKVTENQVADTKNTEQTNSPKSQVQKKIQPTSKTLYYIIIASYSKNEKARAEYMVNQLKDKGLSAKILFSSQRYRVSIGDFTNEEEAIANRDKYRKITNKQDLWIYKERSETKKASK